MRRKNNKANQNVILQALCQFSPLGLLIKLKQPSGSPNGAKSVQSFIMIDELLAAL
jgi:hypothetical protein